MEFQMFLIWHNAIEEYSYIIQRLSSCFLIKRVYETTWTREETLNNMMQLYQCTFTQAQAKLSECGYGTIIIIVVEDIEPISKLYLTKYGKILVNKHAQEIKTEIRTSFKGKNIIHGTMTDFEFENDIKICLNCTQDEFFKKNKTEWDGDVCKI